jgi:two-component system, cell cycle sensor histidine kinase and response regulator CckA
MPQCELRSDPRDASSASGTGVKPRDYVRVEISDTGVGMEPGVQVQMFDPFFTRRTGLGLGSGGQDPSGARRENERGERAWPRQPFTLGSGCRKTRRQHNSMATAHKPLRRGTVLVVDDEELLRVALVKGLKRKGYSVLEASDGAGALALIRSDPSQIDSILLDMVFPGKISSRAVFEEAQRIKPGLKIILTSAYSEETAIAAFSGIRIEHFLRKPIHFADLVKLLDNGLDW